MKKKLRALFGLVCVILIIALIVLLGGGSQSFRDKYDGIDLSTDVSGLGRSDTYANYLLAHGDAALGAETVEVDMSRFTGDGELRTDGDAVAVFCPDGSDITWDVDVPQGGLYNIIIDYLTTSSDAEGAERSRGVDIERELRINGELPFAAAGQLVFTRLWHDSGEVRKDNQGNDIRPTQAEINDWQTAYCRDPMGYEAEPYRFCFKTGANTISLFATNEPLVIRSITLAPVRESRDYAGYIADMPQAASSPAAKTYQSIVQGEDAALRSSPSLYARYDRSSSDTVPYSVYNTVLNYIGGDPWNYAGQWIEWAFEVPEDGWYTITVKARQAYQRGALSCRTVYIDGEIPFSELNSVAFNYSTAWNMRTLGDENGQPYRFYLTKGAHTLRLEATLGEMGPVLQQIEDSIYRLNLIYRKILVLTGVNPDRFRDYNIAQVYPEVITAMDLESKRLYKIVDDTVAIAGQKSDRAAVAQTLAVQLESFVEHNERITQSFGNFKDNITSLGTAMQNMSETKLDVDMVIISGEDAPLPASNDNFFTKIGHEIRSCVASYFVDYNSLGDKYDEGDTSDLIAVWIVTGRDQSAILKTMVDDTFTPATGIHVNVKLVLADTLLTTVVAGNGPDVVLSVGSWFPVNYAMRNAVEDLTQFSDFGEVTQPFFASALTPASYNDGIYALPETQEFSVLFYRKDVLEELGLNPPATWGDLLAILPTIQGNNMSVGIPYPDITNVDMSVFNSMIYQNGGAIYDDEAKRTLIDNESGVAAFELYTSLYNDYGLPVVYDFVSRFRSGEMPLGVASYTAYNTLVVSAPEIRGLWDFTLFPGTLQPDGSVDRSVHSQGVCCMMIATDDENIKHNSWEFMKWWVSEDVQVRFGRELESVLGSSARYATANRGALERLAWSAAQLGVLKTQMAHTVGFREIAGGYSTTRHMTNAIRRVINDKDDARETILTYARTINEEIAVKRREFGLPVD